MIFLFFGMLLLILNPYTLIGPVGYYAALPFLLRAIFLGKDFLTPNIFLAFFVCIAVSIFGVLSSVLHGITQFDHFKVSLSILAYYLIGVGLFVAYNKKISFDALLKVSLYVGVLNGVVILIQVLIPEFRSVIESVFVESGNIDWKEGFRFRGLASGGGASLSVLSAFMVYICLYLFGARKIGAPTAFLSMCVLIASIFFIGRTGVLLILIGLLIYVVNQGIFSLKNIMFTVFLAVFFIIFGLDLIKSFLIGQYGEEFYRYALGYFLEGRDGIQEEGTLSMIGDFLLVIPTQFPEILIGYGFYGGSEFYPWTDSGYARMFLSVGFLGGGIFYGFIFYIFVRSAIGKQKLFWPLVALLGIAEAKEAMMFGGYSSRLLFILMGFWVSERSVCQSKSLS